MTLEEMRRIKATYTPDDIRAKRNRIDYGISLLSKKWFWHVLATIGIEPRGFNDLLKEYNISPRALSETLSLLEKNEMISRVVYSTKPIKVNYSITDTGMRFILEVGESINQFVEHYIPKEVYESWDGYDYKTTKKQ